MNRTGRGWNVAIHPSAKAERRLRMTLREMTPPNLGAVHYVLYGQHPPLHDRWMSHYRPATGSVTRETVQGLGARKRQLSSTGT
jgi:hypothetical protein